MMYSSTINLTISYQYNYNYTLNHCVLYFEFYEVFVASSNMHIRFSLVAFTFLHEN